MTNTTSFSSNSLEKNCPLDAKLLHGVSRGGAGGVTPVSPPSLLANYGVDTILLVFHATIPGELLEQLADAKTALQSGQGDEVYFPFGESRQFSFTLQRQGTRYYQFVLRSGDVRLCFATRNADSTIPNMQLSIGSVSCQDNLNDLYKSFRLWMKHHKITIIHEKVSRIDLCADIAIPISETSIDMYQFQISRSRKIAVYSDNYELTGVQVGKDELVMRCYDKIREMDDKNAVAKSQFFQNKWGNRTEITRVEFQIRREVIKEFFPKISTFSKVTRKLSELWKYLTTKWFRQVDTVVDRTSRHQDRYSPSEFWQIVQSAFNGEKKTPMMRNRKQLHINVPALVRQATGVMLTVASALGHVSEDVTGIMQTITAAITKTVKEKLDDSRYCSAFDGKWANAVLSF